MIYKIENEYLSAEINDYGCELHSIRSKKSSTEYLWQGDPSIWSGRSPILFPIIGRLLDDKFNYKGKDYSLPKHGFARSSYFELVNIDEDSAVFLLKYNESTLQCYPFKFDLNIHFKLTDNYIVVSHTVINKSEDELYFSIGAHPGFNCKIGDYLEFSENETINTERIDDNAIIIEEKFPLLNNDKKISITSDIFNNDALFLSGMKSTMVSLKSVHNTREVRFDFGKAPFLGIWAKPAAPYVCIEPWYGINDDYSVKRDISEKRGIQKLNSFESFEFSWAAQIIE